MLTITPAAAEYIKSRKKPIFLDIPPLISCCLHLKESPSVRFGEPHDPQNFTRQSIQGFTVFVPHELPEIPLTITLSKFLSIKKLVVEGWCLG
ncbi:MAG: CC/Se motif family (seleno)protein [Negativicutes bacterium]|nr:CC/Se motif family (seleno)protein [Negativicutes bacterium]